MPEPFPILTIEPEWVKEPETLGTKEKFWFHRPGSDADWLFKFPQPNTGQHWAERLAAAFAARLEVMHAAVCLAVFGSERGSATESFTREGRSLVHGNQVLAGKVAGYSREKKFRRSDHTFGNVLLAIEGAFLKPERVRRAKSRLADYLVLDALIGNSDRHDENWGILRKQTENQVIGGLAPTFDHASSLGRELRDDVSGHCRRMLIEEDRVGAYSEKARGGIYWESTDKHGLSPLEMVRRASRQHAEFFAPALARLQKLDRTVFEEEIARMPQEWMSPWARRFAIALLCYNLEELRKLPDT